MATKKKVTQKAKKSYAVKEDERGRQKNEINQTVYTVLIPFQFLYYFKFLVRQTVIL